MIRLIDGLVVMFARLPYALIALIGRWAIGLTFWNAGQTMLDGYLACLPKLSCFHANPFSVGGNTLSLFATDYIIPHIHPWYAAHAVALAEFVLPILLFVGLATRFAALGLLIIVLAIEVFVYPGSYVVHGLWAAVLLMLIKWGPGQIALDHWLARRY